MRSATRGAYSPSGACERWPVMTSMDECGCDYGRLGHEPLVLVNYRETTKPPGKGRLHFPTEPVIGARTVYKLYPNKSTRLRQAAHDALSVATFAAKL